MESSHTYDIGYQIQQISHFLKQIQNAQLLTEGLSISHVNVMYVLYTQDCVTQSFIQKKLGIKASSLSKLIDILMQKGLVTRKVSERDARIKLICLTPSGKTKKAQLYAITKDIEQQLTLGLEKTEITTLSALLSTVKSNLESFNQTP